MITGLDHVALAVAEIEAGIAAYRVLLGREPTWRAERDGVATAIIALPNMALELMAPTASGRLRDVLDAEGEGLKSIAFATNDIEKLHRRLSRVALSPEPISAAESVDARGATLLWRRTRAETARAHGVRQFFLQRDQAPPASDILDTNGVTAIDHVVLRTADADRAAALYGARLGLDLRLDLDTPQFGGRFLFFRCGDAILEIVQSKDEPEQDRLWGLSWRVADVDAAQARLVAAGLDVSPVRPGRKPGTRVFSVRNGTCGVPTLMVGPS